MIPQTHCNDDARHGATFTCHVHEAVQKPSPFALLVGEELGQGIARDNNT